MRERATKITQIQAPINAKNKESICDVVEILHWYNSEKLDNNRNK